MKKIFLVIFILTFTYTLQAQYVPKEEREKKEEKKEKEPKDVEKKEKETNDKTTQQKNKKDKNEESFFDKMFFIPGLWFAFGDVTIVDVSLMVGYKVTDNYQIGIGGGYIHQSERVFDRFTGQSLGRVKQNVLSLRAFNRFFVYEGAFLQAEYEMMNISYDGFEEVGFITPANRTLHIPLIGAGYAYSLGGRGAVVITALYDLNYSESFSVYPSPFRVRFGFMF